MKHRFIFVVFLAILGNSCVDRKKDKLLSIPSNEKYVQSARTGFIINEGIYVEKIDSQNLYNPFYADQNFYNVDNKIFRTGSQFEYSYEYIDSVGNKFYSDQEYPDWEFIESTDEKSKKVILEVLPGLLHKNYFQTSISYSYPPNDKFSVTGVIENQENVWLHPPRDGLFKILELNPFPFIMSSYRVGNTWEWELDVGAQWSDKRWKLWEGNIHNNYKYQITKIEEIECGLGKVRCFVIESTCHSNLGTTSLTSYFNEEHGFVRLDYFNINKSRLVFELISHKR